MTAIGLTDTDISMKDAVMRQLEWDPEVDASAIGVAARGGTVTLTGYTDSYSGKLAAERAAKRVHGVRGVANDVEVRLKLERTDADIAQVAEGPGKPAKGGTRVDTLKGGDYVRVWINRGANHYLIHLPV